MATENPTTITYPAPEPEPGRPCAIEIDFETWQRLAALADEWGIPYQDALLRLIRAQQAEQD